jgi:hypothetical protein
MTGSSGCGTKRTIGTGLMMSVVRVNGHWIGGLAHALEDRVPNLPLGRLRPVLDLRHQRRLNPDALVRNLLDAGWVC